MNLQNYLPIITLALLFVYNIALFSYAAKVLSNSRKNKFLYVLFSCINTTVVICFMGREELYSFAFFLIGIMLFFEFRLLAKTVIRQILFGAVIFAYHIATIHIFVLMSFSAFLKIAPLDLLINHEFSYYVLLVTVVIALSALIIMEQIIPVRYIKRISLASPYAETLTGTTFFILLYLSFDIFCLVTDYYFPAQSLQFIVILTISIGVFYYLLLYTIQFINLSMYKAQSDFAQKNYNDVEIRRKEASNKLVMDQLTKLYNKKYIFEKLDEIINTSDAGFGLIFIDVNALKYVNDTYGHDKGDIYLIETAGVIAESLRETDLAARISGDEFLVILLGVESSAALDLVSTRIKEQVSQKQKIEDFTLSISLGAIYITPEETKQNLAVLLDRVDLLMRQDKKQFYSHNNQGYGES